MQGFTLMEALIGFLILTIGMLGVASLQAFSLKAGKTAVYSSVAMIKVEELFESMRINNSAAALAQYVGGGTLHNCTGANDCTQVLLAQDDVFLWNQDLSTGLPGTAAAVVAFTAPAAPSRLATMSVTISWQERDKDSTGFVNKSYATTANICTQAPC